MTRWRLGMWLIALGAKVCQLHRHEPPPWRRKYEPDYALTLSVRPLSKVQVFYRKEAS